jgi:hypothetical protein
MLSSGEKAADKAEIRDALMQWFAIQEVSNRG